MKEYSVTYPEPIVHKANCQHLKRGIVRHSAFTAENVEQAKRFAAMDLAQSLDHFDGRYEVKQTDTIEAPTGYLIDYMAAYEEAMKDVGVAGCAQYAGETR